MAFQFKIQLRDITHPPVWRRLLVPEQFTFYQLHLVIQAAFEWDNYHLFQFSPGSYGSKPLIAIPHPEWEADVRDAEKVKLTEIFTTPGQKFVYIYDFGDDWFHQITLEEITPEKLLKAGCLAGKGACPPEDCGGPWGYANLKAILEDPKDPEHKEMKEWLGLAKNEKWDAHAFDLEVTGKRVSEI